MTANPQPDTQRGWLTTHYVDHKGKKLGPYYVRRWKDNGKLHRQYIKAKDVDRVRAECQANRDKRNGQVEIDKKLNTFRGNWDFVNRIYARTHQGKGVSLEEAVHILRIQRQGWDAADRPKLRRKRQPFQILHPRRDFMFDPWTSIQMRELLMDQLPAWLTKRRLPSPCERSEQGEGPGVGVNQTSESMTDSGNRATNPFMVPQSTKRPKSSFTKLFMDSYLAAQAKEQRKNPDLATVFMRAFKRERKKRRKLALPTFNKSPRRDKRHAEQQPCGKGTGSARPSVYPVGFGEAI